MYVHTKTVGFFFFFHFKCACHRFPLVNCCLSVFRSVHSCICTYVLWDFYLQVTSEHLLLRRCFYWHVGRFIDLFVVALFVKFFFFSSKKKNTNCVWNLYECMHSGNLPKWQRNVRNWAWEQLTISFFFFFVFFFYLQFLSTFPQGQNERCFFGPKMIGINQVEAWCVFIQIYDPCSRPFQTFKHLKTFSLSGSLAVVRLENITYTLISHWTMQ